MTLKSGDAFLFGRKNVKNSVRNVNPYKYSVFWVPYLRKSAPGKDEEFRRSAVNIRPKAESRKRLVMTSTSPYICNTISHYLQMGYLCGKVQHLLKSQPLLKINGFFLFCPALHQKHNTGWYEVGVRSHVPKVIHKTFTLIGKYAYYLRKVLVYVLSTKGPLNR